MNNDFKILWAEDEDTLREVMCELIRSEGYQCIPAEDGQVAQELLKEQKFDLLITDFNMPRVDGAELLFWCRKNGVHLPVIFVTATVDRLPIEELVLKDCCCSIVNKPFSIEVLLEEIEKSLKRNHEFDCIGKTVPLDQGDYEESFPGQHYLP